MWNTDDKGRNKSDPNSRSYSDLAGSRTTFGSSIPTTRNRVSSMGATSRPRRLSHGPAGSPRSQKSFNSSEHSWVKDLNEKENLAEDKLRDISTLEIMKNYYQPMWVVVVGMTASVCAAFQLPIFGYVLSQYIFVLALNRDTSAGLDEYTSERNTWSIYFVLLCLGIGLSTYIQKICFGIGGENLTLTLRVKLFENILRKHIGWFDNKSRAPGILNNIISEDIAAINGLTTEAVGILLEAGLGLAVSCGICFIFSWQLALVVTLISPFMVIGGLGMSKLQFN